MKLKELIYGEKIIDVRYLAHRVVIIAFDSGKILEIIQPQQAGGLEVYVHDEEVIADDGENDDE
jgi:hypothetical protein